MDHTYIEENQIADRYVMGTLPAEEVERFEDHYLSCPECLDRLELAEPIQRGFKRMAGQDAAKLSAARQLGQLAIVAWLARLGRSRQIGVLLAALLLVAVLPAGLVLRGTAERGRELAQARSFLAQERHRSAAGAQSAAEAERLRSELAASRTGEREARTQLAQALKPQGNVSFLNLDVERGAGPSEGEPTHSVRLPAGSGPVVLSLPIDPPFRRSYVAVLRDARGRELSRIADLRNQGGTLTLSLPATLLPPGSYSVTIEPAAGRFTFRVLPPA
ncbi:MAG TPA: zf-HC2 domain-containing protein [Thermoanaerobaculia bacterium]|jgi:hypothetical protein|nr:zf-HC2 domain-containing protein [Thermoanaerobaculia bacterium]